MITSQADYEQALVELNKAVNHFRDTYVGFRQSPDFDFVRKADQTLGREVNDATGLLQLKVLTALDLLQEA